MRVRWLSGIAAVLCLSTSVVAQEAAYTGARGIARFPLERSGLVMRGAARPWAYQSSVGQRAAVVGSEAGRLDVWTWPLRLVRDLHLEFKLEGQADPIDASAIARQVELRPEGATIVYAHPAFTVREHVLVPMQDAGALLLLQVESTRRLMITVRMRADFQMFWPGGFGGGSISWQAERRRFALQQGGVRMYRALIGSPLAAQGVAQPVPDAQQSHSQFVLDVSPAQAATDYIPIAIAGGSTSADSVERAYGKLLTQAQALWRERLIHQRRMQDELGAKTGNAEVDQALEWTKVRLDQPLRTLPALNALAMTALGQFERVRIVLRALAQQQQADGSVPYSAPSLMRMPRLSSDDGSWLSNNGTSFWLLACYQYWSTSGDDALLRELWPAVARAFRHQTRSDNHADIIRAGSWLAALEGLPAMAAALGDATVGGEAVNLFEAEQRKLETFWRESSGHYVAGGKLTSSASALKGTDALTIWPMLALSFGLLDNGRASRMLREVSSSALTSDWGTRTLSSFDSLYQAQSYNSGAVWPVMSGFAALAHYRYHRAWAGYDLVRDLARMSSNFARGHEPDAFSGSFYTTLDPAEPRQFSAAPALAQPLVNGLFGVSVDAANRAVSIEPHLPAEWTTASLQQVRVGRDRMRIDLHRERGKYSVTLQRLSGAAPLFVRIAPALPLGTRVERIRVNDSDAPVQVEESEHDVHAVVEVTLVTEAEVEVEYSGGLEVYAPTEALELGDATESLKVLDVRREGTDYVVQVEGVPGASYTLDLRVESRVRAIVGADLLEYSQDHMQLRVRFSAGVTPVARRDVRIRT